MTLLFDDATDEENSEKTVAEDIDFDSMSSEEFFDDLIRETASELDVSVAELEEMSMGEIDELLGTEIRKPYHPRGAREGYRDSDRLKTVSREELEHRRNVVEEKLGL